MHKHFLITGRPGVGKTTLIKRIVAEIRSTLPNHNINGFYTNEVRQDGFRIGFDIHTIDGRQGILARSKVPQFKSKLRVGKYFVNLTDLDNLVVPLLYISTDLLIIDELGKMELFSSKFQKAVNFAFNNQSRILATLPYYKHPFLASIRKRQDIKIFELTHLNQGSIFDYIVQKLHESSKK
ncbi:MAG: NTPase [Candidatus Thorarchaeota archaeon]